MVRDPFNSVYTLTSTTSWLMPAGAASMRTSSVLRRMEMVVASTRTEKMKVQMGSMIAHSGLK